MVLRDCSQFGAIINKAAMLLFQYESFNGHMYSFFFDKTRHSSPVWLFIFKVEFLYTGTIQILFLKPSL